MYRLGISVNYGGLSLAIIKLDDEKKPVRYKRVISRQFPVSRDDKSKKPLNVDRRAKRQIRKNLYRRKMRNTKIFELCKEFNLLEDINNNETFFAQNPYKCRYDAAQGTANKQDLARALFDIARKRGYASSRADSDDDDKKVTLKAIRATELKLKESGQPTVGCYLYLLSQEKNKWGQKIPIKSDTDKALFCKREMYEQEFFYIKDKCSKLRLSEEFWDIAHEIIFFQLPLTTPVSGKCTLYFKYSMSRASRALPSFQRFRILQDLANLKIMEGWEKIPIDDDDKREIFEDLLRQKTVGFSKLHKRLKLEPHQRFNLETDKIKALKGDESGFELSKQMYFGKDWHSFPLSKQDTIVEILITEGNPQKLVESALGWGLARENAEALAKLSVKKFPSGNAHYSQKALRDMVELMEPTFAHPASVKRLLMNEDTGEVELANNLDYYAKVMPRTAMNFTDNDNAIIEERNYGKIGNPTVHVILNQLRKMVNGVIDVYGKPKQIIVQLERELKQSKKIRSEITKQQLANKKNKDKIKSLLEEMGVIATDGQIDKYKLWQELNPKDENGRFCVFTGRQITVEDLHTNQVQALHIWPFARTYDDSVSNKILAYAEVLNTKKDMTPDEAYNHPDSVYGYCQIQQRVKLLPKNKQFKFKPGSFGPYRLNIRSHTAERAYASKVIQEYMKSICKSVWTSAGTLTPVLRKNWDLNDLIPDYDLRQGAIDAAVVGLVERSVIKLANQKSAQGEEIEGAGFELPWPSVKANLQHLLSTMLVAHKPDNRYLNGIYQASLYGQCDPEKNQIKGRKFNLKLRKPIDALTEAAVKRLVDPELRKHLTETRDEWANEDCGIQHAIKKFKRSDVKALKVYEFKGSYKRLKHKDPRVKDKTHHKVVLSGGNHSIKIWKLPKGVVSLRDDNENLTIVKKMGVAFVFESIDLAEEALRQNKKKEYKPHPAAKLMMKIGKSDMVYYKRDDKLTLGRVVALNPAGSRLFVVPHRDGRGSEKRDKISISYNQVLAKDFRKIKVTETGEYHLGRNILKPGADKC